MVNEFEVKAGAVPFLSDFTPFRYSGGLPVTVDGAIVSSADVTQKEGREWEIYMDTVTYVDDSIRIVRDVDDNVYVYDKASESEVLPDLGVASLLESFNDAVTKFY
ncbi:MAG: hypothetical protein RI887_621 [Actinomycetota bacterium]